MANNTSNLNHQLHNGSSSSYMSLSCGSLPRLASSFASPKNGGKKNHTPPHKPQPENNMVTPQQLRVRPGSKRKLPFLKQSSPNQSNVSSVSACHNDAEGLLEYANEDYNYLINCNELFTICKVNSYLSQNDLSKPSFSAIAGSPPGARATARFSGFLAVSFRLFSGAIAREERGQGRRARGKRPAKAGLAARQQLWRQ